MCLDFTRGCCLFWNVIKKLSMLEIRKKYRLTYVKERLLLTAILSFLLNVFQKHVIIQISMHVNFSRPFTGIITVDELPDVLDSIGLKPSPEEVEVRLGQFSWNDEQFQFFVSFILWNLAVCFPSFQFLFKLSLCSKSEILNLYTSSCVFIHLFYRKWSQKWT